MEIQYLIDTPTIKAAVGGGVRYVIKEKEGISIRVDLGRTTESAGLYVQLNEAF